MSKDKIPKLEDLVLTPGSHHLCTIGTKQENGIYEVSVGEWELKDQEQNIKKVK